MKKIPDRNSFACAPNRADDTAVLPVTVIRVSNVSKHFSLPAKKKKHTATHDRQNIAGDNPLGRLAESLGPEGVFRAVDDVSFECHPGRVFSLLGPNGSGKTTLLRMIATLLTPTSGEICVAGHDVGREARRVKRKLGFLTGSTSLYDRLTPLETVVYFAQLHGMSKATARAKSEELFDRLGISEFIDRRLGKLSFGMKQKVSIARTMIHDPEVVVFDEPTVGLDVITSRGIIDLIRDCRVKGKTVLFSTHLMGEVAMLSDDMAILHHGRLIFSGAFRDFRSEASDESLEDAFVHALNRADGLRSDAARAKDEAEATAP